MNAPLPPEVVQLSASDAIRLGSTSLTRFGRLFLPKTFRQASPEFHEDISSVLATPARLCAFEVFRDGAKTTLLRTFTLKRIAYAISRTIMYISVSQAHSMISLRWLKRQIEWNTRLQPFGLLKGDKWSDEWMEVRHGVEDVPITILAAGVTGQIRGFNIDDFRPDLIVVDDVLSDENTATPEQRKKLEELLFGALLNSLAPVTEAPLAKAVFINTPFHKQDAIEKCAGDPEWVFRRYGILTTDGKSAWEARYPTEQVLAAKTAATRKGRYRLWMREKECRIVSGEEKCINIERLQYWDVYPEDVIKVITIDPASSDSKKADQNIVMCVAQRGIDIFVLAYYASKGTMPDECANQFFQLAITFAPIMRAGVESISYQRTLKWYIGEQMRARRIFIPIREIQDKRSKANRITQMIPGLVALGHLHVHPSMQDLIDQMDDYDPMVKDQPDDLLDALAMAILELRPELLNNEDDALEGEFVVVDDGRGERKRHQAVTTRGCP